jgi:hypothetical protein
LHRFWDTTFSFLVEEERMIKFKEQIPRFITNWVKKSDGSYRCTGWLLKNGIWKVRMYRKKKGSQKEEGVWTREYKTKSTAMRNAEKRLET